MKITRDKLATIIREEMAALDERGPVGGDRGPEEDDPGMIEEEEELEEGEDWERYDAPDVGGSSPANQQWKKDRGYNPDWRARDAETKRIRDKPMRWDENKKLTKEALRRLVEEEIEKLFYKK